MEAKKHDPEHQQPDAAIKTMSEATDMTHKITKKIVGYKVLSKDDVEPVKQEPEQPHVESMNENLSASGSAARLHLQNQNPAVGACAVHHDQRHDPERRTPPTKNVGLMKSSSTPKTWSISNGCWR